MIEIGLTFYDFDINVKRLNKNLLLLIFSESLIRMTPTWRKRFQSLLLDFKASCNCLIQKQFNHVIKLKVQLINKNTIAKKKYKKYIPILYSYFINIGLSSLFN